MLCNSDYCPFLQECKRHVKQVPLHHKRYKDMSVKDFTIGIIIGEEGLYCYRFKEKLR